MVTSGVHSKEDVERLQIYPNRIVEDLLSLFKKHLPLYLSGKMLY